MLRKLAARFARKIARSLAVAADLIERRLPEAELPIPPQNPLTAESLSMLADEQPIREDAVHVERPLAGSIAERYSRARESR